MGPLQIVVEAGLTKNSRAAVITSKNVSKKAVVRNQIRRRIQALLPTLLKKVSPIDVIIRVAPGAVKENSTSLRENLSQLWPTHVPAPSNNYQRHPRLSKNSIPRP
jgi:ribonuclease P protein component